MRVQPESVAINPTHVIFSVSPALFCFPAPVWLWSVIWRKGLPTTEHTLQMSVKVLVSTPLQDSKSEDYHLVLSSDWHFNERPVSEPAQHVLPSAFLRHAIRVACFRSEDSTANGAWCVVFVQAIIVLLLTGPHCELFLHS